MSDPLLSLDTTIILDICKDRYGTTHYYPSVPSIINFKSQIMSVQDKHCGTNNYPSERYVSFNLSYATKFTYQSSEVVVILSGLMDRVMHLKSRVNPLGREI